MEFFRELAILEPLGGEFAAELVLGLGGVGAGEQRVLGEGVGRGPLRRVRVDHLFQQGVELGRVASGQEGQPALGPDRLPLDAVLLQRPAAGHLVDGQPQREDVAFGQLVVVLVQDLQRQVAAVALLDAHRVHRRRHVAQVADLVRQRRRRRQRRRQRRQRRRRRRRRDRRRRRRRQAVAVVVLQLVEAVVAVVVHVVAVHVGRVAAADEDVARFDVQVRQLLRVDVVQPFGDLQQQNTRPSLDSLADICLCFFLFKAKHGNPFLAFNTNILLPKFLRLLDWIQTRILRRDAQPLGNPQVINQINNAPVLSRFFEKICPIIFDCIRDSSTFGRKQSAFIEYDCQNQSECWFVEMLFAFSVRGRIQSIYPTNQTWSSHRDFSMLSFVKRIISVTIFRKINTNSQIVLRNISTRLAPS